MYIDSVRRPCLFLSDHQMTCPRQWTCQEQSTDMVANCGSMYKIPPQVMHRHSDQPGDHHNKHEIQQSDQCISITGTGNHRMSVNAYIIGQHEDRQPVRRPHKQVTQPNLTSCQPIQNAPHSLITK